MTRVSSISPGLARALGPSLMRALAMLVWMASGACYDVHEPPAGTHRVKVEQLFDDGDGFARLVVPEQASVVAWACEGDWREESRVFEDGHAYFSPPEGLDCWNLTAADLHYERAGGASTFLGAPVPLEESIVLPTAFEGPPASMPSSVALHVTGLPPGTERVEISILGSHDFGSGAIDVVDTSEVELSATIFGEPTVGDALLITALALRDGFPVDGAEVFVVVPSEEPRFEITFGTEPMPVEVAEVALFLSEGGDYPASEAQAEPRSGGVTVAEEEFGPYGLRDVGIVQLDELAAGEWAGEARWLPFTEEAPQLRVLLGWTGRGVGASGELWDAQLRLAGSADAFSAAEVPPLTLQRMRIDTTSEGSIAPDAEIGDEGFVTSLKLFPVQAKRWFIETLGPGRVRLDSWPALPAGHAPEDVLGTNPDAISFALDVVGSSSEIADGSAGYSYHFSRPASIVGP